MVNRWGAWRNPWQREYAMRGALWRGVTRADFLSPWVSPGGLVLDLGCGDGKFLQGLEAAGHLPVGLDFASTALERARERVAAPLVRGDLRALPLATGGFPVVAARYALGALLAPDRRRAADEIERVLAPGGTLLMEEFSPLDFRFGAGEPVEPATFERNRGITTHYFEEGEPDRLFRRLRVQDRQEVVSRQRTSSGLKMRHRWRWVLSTGAGHRPEEPVGVGCPSSH